MVDHHISTFSNNIRLVHKQVINTKIIHCGFIIDIGSRDEDLNDQGIVHFWEHMAFKGTKTRKYYHIINSLESVGGEINAFTTKEKICFYASVQTKYFVRAVDLLSDIVFFSIFPEKEIIKERQVILDEMLMYQDIPEDSIQDDFDMVLFPSQPLGRNILGTKESIKSIKRKDFLRFIKNNLNSSRIVFSVVGNISSKECYAIVEKSLSGLPYFPGTINRKSAVPGISKNITLKKSISRAYCAIGNSAYSIKDENRLVFFMLSNILGGPAMNSRLNMELRERRGLVYSIDALYSPFSDTGIFGIFFGTEFQNLEKSIQLVRKEMNKLKTKALGILQLNKAKEQIIGQLAMAEENNVNLMIMMGRSLLDIDRIDLLDDIFRDIRKIKSADMQRVAREVFSDKEISTLVYIPE
jgi:predicted Zn-dependent peptidase